MEITISIKPRYDDYNSSPPKVDFIVRDKTVTLVTRGDGQSAEREIQFNKEDFKSISKLVEE